ncbi:MULTISPECIES: DUF3035 domain-containing protein [Sphingomonas]|jgi:hypothetical protein|uniref:Beta-barrel assembly complex subunit BamF n=1 Tax=Sphingomonas aerolata TaxID=185951 RepID=A0A2T4YQK9_9SPHN|nr:MULTISPECIES: DUF3035 domain-containing protein [Sphingomonas]KHA63898.1 hypothetical protein NI18_12895 [Sphingomonas sp. Ant20]KQM99551.1 hypothetical protein ASE77_00775 [Sphingomonas sp. Leaf226]MBB3585466.1 hypothetical protein [Sphingomonas sp. BK481]MBD8469062.1 DUF3035 domain-containing protein [Sphingomonas sp. CFBP 8765]MBD8699167.1 DUF3035 domain-containing protein [Sphingomonas sp. CFBP 13714]
MRKFVPLAAGLASVALLSGCGAGKSLDRARPDEFAVARQAPLVIPPDFALVPPQPGAARPQDTAANAQTLDALFGGTAARSPAEAGVLSEAGPSAADPGIRSSAGDPGTTVIDKGSTTRDIVAAPEGDGQDARATAN